MSISDVAVEYDVPVKRGTCVTHPDWGPGVVVCAEGPLLRVRLRNGTYRVANPATLTYHAAPDAAGAVENGGER